eukprot:scaffold20056_cov131-Isochrysis_galbana.AAC.2
MPCTRLVATQPANRWKTMGPMHMVANHRKRASGTRTTMKTRYCTAKLRQPVVKYAWPKAAPATPRCHTPGAAAARMRAAGTSSLVDGACTCEGPGTPTARISARMRASEEV